MVRHVALYRLEFRTGCYVAHPLRPTTAAQGNNVPPERPSGEDRRAGALDAPAGTIVTVQVHQDDLTRFSWSAEGWHAIGPGRV